MRKEISSYLNLFSYVTTTALLSIVVVFATISDELFFRTDSQHLVYFFSGSSLLISIPLFLIILISIKFNWLARPRIESALAGLMLSLLILGFLICGGDFLHSTFSRGVKTFYEQWFAVILVGFIVLSALLYFRLPDLEGSKRNVTVLAKYAGGFCVAAFLLLSVYARLPSGNGDKHVVMIVIDRLSPNNLSFYNPDAAPTPGFDKVARESLAFTRMHTNRTYTHGFFGIFYGGRKSAKQQGSNNLVNILRKNSVLFKWIGYHGNGLADTHGVKYDGLRGSLLNQHFYWLPALLGIPYHFFWYDGRYSRGKKITDTGDWILDKSHNALGGDRLSLYDDLAMDEIKRAQSFNKSSFVILYTDESAELDPSPPWCADNSPRCKIEKRVDRRHYTYEPRDAEWVKSEEEAYTRRVELATDGLERFYEKFKKAGLDKDTMLIVTADHGSIYGKKRIWYTYHAEEEVTRVPFLLHWGNKVGVDTRLVESIDITQTILDFFGIEKSLTPEAISLLGDKTKTYTTSLTRRSDTMDEFLLAVYQGDYKFVYNILKPELPFSVNKIEHNFDTVEVQKNTENAPKFDVTRIMKDYHIKDPLQSRH
jgi:hypothetical protein